jgi:hypothetical protein
MCFIRVSKKTSIPVHKKLCMKKILLFVLPVVVFSGCSQMASKAEPKDSMVVVKDSDLVKDPATEMSMPAAEPSASTQVGSAGAVPAPKLHGQRAKPPADTAEAAMNGEGSGTIPKPKPPRKQR